VGNSSKSLRHSWSSLFSSSRAAAQQGLAVGPAEFVQGNGWIFQMAPGQIGLFFGEFMVLRTVSAISAQIPRFFRGDDDGFAGGLFGIGARQISGPVDAGSFDQARPGRPDKDW
jgi:hypothetical protein